jgi:predicted HTH transcriptional regulator
VREETDKILEKIRLGEDSCLELINVAFSGGKIKSPPKEDLADEMAAMANAVAGQMALGAKGKSQNLEGLTISQIDLVEKWVEKIGHDLIDPPLFFLTKKTVGFEGRGEKKFLLRVEIPRSSFVHKSPNGYFYRSGSSKMELKPEMLARLFQQRGQARFISFDGQIVPDATADALEPKLYRRFRTVLSPADDVVFLEKLKFIAKDESGDYRATAGGLLLASENPEEFLPNAYIQAVCYGTVERNGAHQLDAQDMTDPLDEQIKQACKFVRRNMKVRGTKAPFRIETPQFSLNAVFEAVVNAVAHRDYSIFGSKIRLHVFPDRLELFSPGNLADTLTADSLSERQSTRNELICSMLARCPMNFEATGSRRKFIMDQRGEGIPIIVVESEDLSGKRPIFKVIDNAELKLTIFSA